MFGLWKRKERLKFAYVTANEKGLVRKDNEDTALVDEAKTVFCVADALRCAFKPGDTFPVRG